MPHGRPPTERAASSSSGRAQPSAQAQLLVQRRVRVRRFFQNGTLQQNWARRTLLGCVSQSAERNASMRPPSRQLFSKHRFLLDRQRIGVRSMQSSELDPEDHHRDAHSSLPPDNHFSQRCLHPKQGEHPSRFFDWPASR